MKYAEILISFNLVYTGHKVTLEPETYQHAVLKEVHHFANFNNTILSNV